MDMRRLSPELATQLEKQEELAKANCHRADYVGVESRFLLAFSERAMGAIVEEFIRKTPEADVLTAVVKTMSHLIATTIVNVTQDEDVVCMIARQLHDRLHQDFRKMRAGQAAGARITGQVGKPLVVSMTGGVPS